jgi:hypothetical protein
MGNPIQKIETSQSSCPAPLLKDEISADFPTFWAIGNLGLLDTNLLGVFCSIRCPGNIILNTYDLYAPILRDCRRRGCQRIPLAHRNGLP